MRVVQVVPGLAWTGGMQEYVAGLSRGLHGHGAEVVILAGGTGAPDGPPPNALADGLDVRWHPKRRVAGRYTYPAGLARSVRDLARWADVVHAHQPRFVGTWLAAATRAPLVANLHLHPEHVEGSMNRRRRVQLRVLLRRLDLVAAVSHAELSLVRSIGAPRRARVVWPGIDIDDHGRDSARRSAGDRPLVLHVGRLSSAKGLDATLRAFALVSDVCEVVAVGEGPERSRFEQLCRELGMDPTSVLVGPLGDDDVAELYRRASVFVSCSTQEAFGIAVMKSIAHGCTPIVSDIASHREIILGLGLGEEHLLQLPIDHRELAGAIRAAVAAPPPPRAVVDAIPSWSDAAATMLDAYAEVARPVRRVPRR
jgi:glycosyltransferase involved in cell wall biosynthesis